MEIWTTFCPSKLCWELTYAKTAGKAPTSDWLKHQDLINASLQKLKTAQIFGIRLVIFPSEITKDGKQFDWHAVETMLNLCTTHKIAVSFCVGPFQYPHYPGIYLPPELLRFIFDDETMLDTNPALRTFGNVFLRTQLEKYGNDKRIAGFHLANEWPDRQNIAGKELLKKTVSEDFMLKTAGLVTSLTQKPISLNTNIDVSDKRNLTNTFANLLTILGVKGQLGFDIYPSRESWLRTPLLKLLRLIMPYTYSFRTFQKKFSACQMYFAEVEAQPWGNGKAWFTLIHAAKEPNFAVLTYTKNSLAMTWKKYIASSGCFKVSLWGVDFWLVADALGISWPLAQVKKLASGKV